MVVEVLCSENAMSPRISFSHDFSQFDVIPVERIQHPLRSNSSSSSRLNSSSSIDFDFHVLHDELASLENQTSSADELFSNGRIVPTQIKNIKKEEFNNNNNRCIHIHEVSNPVELLTTRTNPTQEESVVTTNNNNNGIIIRKKETKEMSNSKSFWSFKRSSSCGSGYGRRLCPLPLLSRSNSTGSSPKRVPLSSSSSMKQQNSQKHYYSYSSTTTTTRSCSSSSNSNSNNNNNHHIKPPLKRSHNNSVRVNPVLNVAPVTLFGFRSIFSNNRDRSKKK